MIRPPTKPNGFATFYTTDAPGLEAALHQAFDAKRANRMNPRKKFFQVTLNEIRDMVVKNHADIEFTLAAEAREYRETVAMRAVCVTLPWTAQHKATAEWVTPPHGL